MSRLRSACRWTRCALHAAQTRQCLVATVATCPASRSHAITPAAQRSVARAAPPQWVFLRSMVLSSLTVPTSRALLSDKKTQHGRERMRCETGTFAWSHTPGCLSELEARRERMRRSSRAIPFPRGYSNGYLFPRSSVMTTHVLLISSWQATMMALYPELRTWLGGVPQTRRAISSCYFPQNENDDH
ncbi:hypothetical protein BV25DRAFT_1827667 [Artomyces pyxidatus]|uniref:Uncharacterized protein n=1 Tax=Artomyces pyxidatus TaxID=48021 RepID=A0ACB8SVG2_9AGAM|nr:hypothetical protein BV25DRAFT_1827667 [Artomyces pyxidatus]